jgi:hypothetical protein
MCLVRDLWWRCCVLLVGFLSHVLGEAPRESVSVFGLWLLVAGDCDDFDVWR